MIGVLLVDDQELVRSGFRLIVELQDDMAVVGEASNGREAVELARAHRPDVVLMDVRMPVLDGIAATRAIAHASPEAHVLVLTTFDLDEYVYDSVKAGASGFLLKDAGREQLIHAIRTVAAGDSLLAPAVTRRLIERFSRLPRPGDSPTELAGLSERELEVLREVARGRSNAEIGRSLFVTEATVKTHVSRILQKLGLRDRVQAVVLAYETGLVEPGSEEA